jgi:hypothetical protein
MSTLHDHMPRTEVRPRRRCRRGFPAAGNAVDRAADEAALRGTAPEILHAWEWKAYEAGVD